MNAKLLFLTIVVVVVLVLAGFFSGYITRAKNTKADLESKMNSYLYQQFKVDDYTIQYGPNCRDCSGETLNNYLKEKTILIQLISDYNNTCLNLRSKDKSEDCNIIEYNNSL